MAADIRPALIALLPRLRAFARALARTPQGADDLLQAACEKALRSADTWIPGTRLDSWMFRIIQNQWIDTKRRARPEVSIEAEIEEGHLVGEDGARSMEARLTLQRVRALIDGLPDDLRAVLVLTCVEDMSYRETAEILELPIGTVMSRLARARRTLIETMEAKAEPNPLPGERA